MEKIEDFTTNMALSYDEVVANIRANEKRNLLQIYDLPDWREGMPIAIVGGGPSLKETLPELRKFKHVMVCGSAHDFVVEQGIIPRWCVVCDPDPVMANYLRRAHMHTKFLVASQCDAAVFEELKDRNVVLWHCGGDKKDNDTIWNTESTLVVGGGTTVATRAMIIAMCFGYSNQHLFGMDTCVRGDTTHAYHVGESIGPLFPIRLASEDGPEFMMAKYHVAQLRDFKLVLKLFGDRVRFTVHGDGVLAELMRISRDTAQKLKAA